MGKQPARARATQSGRKGKGKGRGKPGGRFYGGPTRTPGDPRFGCGPTPSPGHTNDVGTATSTPIHHKAADKKRTESKPYHASKRTGEAWERMPHCDTGERRTKSITPETGAKEGMQWAYNLHILVLTSVMWVFSLIKYTAILTAEIWANCTTGGSPAILPQNRGPGQERHVAETSAKTNPPTQTGAACFEPNTALLLQSPLNHGTYDADQSLSRPIDQMKFGDTVLAERRGPNGRGSVLFSQSHLRDVF